MSILRGYCIEIRKHQICVEGGDNSGRLLVTYPKRRKCCHCDQAGKVILLRLPLLLSWSLRPTNVASPNHLLRKPLSSRMMKRGRLGVAQSKSKARRAGQRSHAPSAIHEALSSPACSWLLRFSWRQNNSFSPWCQQLPIKHKKLISGCTWEVITL